MRDHRRRHIPVQAADREPCLAHDPTRSHALRKAGVFGVSDGAFGYRGGRTVRGLAKADDYGNDDDALEAG
jgi:hypothetical protein